MRLTGRYAAFGAIAAVAVVVAALLGSLLWSYADQQRRFDLESARHQQLLTARLQQADAAAVALATLFTADHYVDAGQFHLLADGLMARLPFLDAALYAPRVAAAERQDFERSVREEGIPGFRIDAAAGQPFHYPVRYFQPFTPLTARLLGVDLHFRGHLAAAIGRAVADDAAAVVTGPWFPGAADEWWLLRPLYGGRGRPEAAGREALADGVVGFALDPVALAEGVYDAGEHLSLVFVDDDGGRTPLFSAVGEGAARLFQVAQRQAIPFGGGRLVAEWRREVGLVGLLGLHSLAALLLGGAAGWLLITLAAHAAARREAEGALRRAYEVLEERVGERTAELEEKARLLATEAAERERAEAGLAEAQRIAHIGSWELDLATDRLRWSEEIYRIFEVDPERFEASYEAFLAAVHPEDREMVDRAYRESMESGEAYDIVHRLRMADGRIKYVNERGRTFHGEGEARRSVGTVQEITERRRAELALEEASSRLEASNRELRQFAYVVSHDLQEPLRMVSSYLQLLWRRYRGRLDNEADEFIGFAVDGATRMSAMIEGLLQYSRVETQGRPFAETDLERVVDGTLANLRLAVEESGASVERGPLPRLRADAEQLGRLFQNLIGNALKFRAEETPRVVIEAVRDGRWWRFSVSDNGIGVDPEQSERLFEMFQRLHTREEYPGMGVGLAVCRRIVERHGGRIWVEPGEGEGAVFRFTLPADHEG